MFCKSIRNIVGFFISLILSEKIAAQDGLEAVKINPLLNHLYQSKSENIEVGNSYERQYFFESDASYTKLYSQSLLKKKDGLYLFINSTGRVYKAVKQVGDSMYFKRLDSTHFYGYNNGAIYVSYNDTLYNFGGWGFWKANGHLRYYSAYNREWNLKPVDKEVALLPLFYYLDTKGGQLYYSGDDKNEAETNSKSTFPVARLDLKNLKNTLLGSLNPIVTNEYGKVLATHIIVPAPSMNGMIVIFNYNNQYLLDFEKNRLLRLTNLGLRDFFLGNSRNQIINNCFIEDSTFYFTYAKDTTYKLYHTKITRKDFESEGVPLYIKPTNWNLMGGIGLLILMAGVTGFYQWKKSRLKIAGKAVNISSILFNEEEAEQSNQFSEGELTVIRFIHDATLSKKYGSVEDINAMLGIGKKTIEVQKKIRTEAISRINHKFKVLTGEDLLLVERIRSEEDRRYQKYMIRSENMEKLLGIMK
ncbi:MAG: hypothetical protein RLZZ420_1268 [Bacteroidota bacterium]|jgi:hypothetical protein